MTQKSPALDAIWVFIGFWVFLALALLVALVIWNTLPASTLAAPADPVASAKTADFVTLVPSPTSTLLANIPTPDLVPAPLIDSSVTPVFVEKGALDKETAQRLYQISLEYIAPTEREANALARKMAFAGASSHASNMCGPLAIALLRDAGLLDVYVDLHDFWLLQLDKNPGLIAEAFPPTHFEYYHFDTPLNEFDFLTFPLFPGDFVYLYAGARGTFNHMLTVTRVDAAGRAYTVTNINGPDGYTVREAVLYDPAQPGIGLFYDYTNKEKNRLYGLTGYGGFDVIRRKTPPVLLSPEQRDFIDRVNSLIVQAGGEWRVLVRSIGEDGTIYDRHADRVGHVASITNVPIAMLFFKSLEKIGIQPSEYREYIANYGSNGRTYEHLLRAMLIYSEDAATNSLLKTIEFNGIRASKTLAEWGLQNTNLGLRRSTARDIAYLYEALYTDKVLPPEATDIILEYLTTYTPGDDTRLGVLRDWMPEGAQFFNKRGSVIKDALIVGDSALITWPQEGEEQVYVLVLLAYDSPLSPTTYERLEAAFVDFARLFWKYVSSISP